MRRSVMCVISAFCMSGCQAFEGDVSNNENKTASLRSFSETVRFPVETVLAVNPILDASCKLKLKIVPIYSGDQFISFQYQDCDSKSVKTTVDQGSVEFIWVFERFEIPPLDYNYPALKIETGNIKEPIQYLDDLYATDEERRYCKRFEKSPGVWEINHIGHLPIPPLPSAAESLVGWEPPRGSSKIEAEKLRSETLKEAALEHYTKFEERRNINRTCENLPIATYIFFNGQYVLTMPKTYPPFLDVTSIKYHRK